MKLIPLGGGHQIGGSAYYLELDGHHYLLDAGILPSRTRQRVDFDAGLSAVGLSGARGLEAVFITHAHLDHIGGLSDLLEQAPGLPIFCHPHTRTLGRRLFQRMPQLLRGRDRLAGHAAFYEQLEPRRGQDYDAPFFPSRMEGESGPEVTLLDAGHLPGSACLLFRGQRESLLFTGDFNHHSSTFLTGTLDNPAFKELRPDVLPCEGTYAGRQSLQGPGMLAPAALGPLVAQVVRRLGTVVIPTFAMGRAQEVLALLAAQEQSSGVTLPIWWDGPITHHNRLLRTLYPGPVGDERLESWLQRDPSLETPRPPVGRPGVVLISSGLLHSTSPALRWLGKTLGDARNAIILTGFQPLEGPGMVLQSVALGATPPASMHVGGRDVRVQARIFACRMSAHADHEGLLTLVRRVAPREIALVHHHQDTEALNTFVKAVAPVPVRLPRNGEVLVW